MLCSVELADALHADGRGARALDVRAHGGEQRGEVGDLRLARAIFHHGFAVGEYGGHQQIFGAGDGDFVEENVRALQAVGAGFDVSVLVADLRAHGFKALDVQIDGARADGAAAGHRDARDAHAGDQRSEHQRRGAHGLHDFVLRGGVGEHATADGGAMLRAAVA